MKTVTYKKSGVDVDKGNRVINNIKDQVKSTHTDKVLSDLGSFGGMFELTQFQYENPVLVSSVDGVGTKLKVAFLMDKHI